LTQVIVRVNGVSHAYLREIGCDCPRCAQHRPRANTSASILINPTADQHDGGYHLLFDIGSGVLDSLMSRGVRRVDAVFNTHNHSDHIAEIERLVSSQRRTSQRNGTPDVPIRFYATHGTWTSGVGAIFPRVANALDWVNLSPHVISQQPLRPAGDAGIDLRLTPVPVYHGPSAFEPVGVVVEFGSGPAYRKLVFCWDMLHLVTQHPAPDDATPRYAAGTLLRPALPGSHGYPTDDYHQLAPEQYAERYRHLPAPADLAPDALLPEHALLHGADEFFVECNTATPQPQTSHGSVLSALHLLRRVKAKRLWIMHYSGHEDSFGPLTDGALEAWAHARKAEIGDEALSSTPVMVAQVGTEIGYHVP
jgi:ribonuclease BN (tRNA processing enzyme)